MKITHKTPVQSESQVYSFNKTYYVGFRVKLEMDNGEIKICTVKHPASITGGHTAVGWFEEINGCYDLDRVRDAVL